MGYPSVECFCKTNESTRQKGKRLRNYSYSLGPIVVFCYYSTVNKLVINTVYSPPPKTHFWLRKRRLWDCIAVGTSLLHPKKSSPLFLGLGYKFVVFCHPATVSHLCLGVVWDSLFFFLFC